MTAHDHRDYPPGWRPSVAVCAECGERFPLGRRGPVALYCGPRCRKRASRRRLKTRDRRDKFVALDRNSGLITTAHNHRAQLAESRGRNGIDAVTGGTSA